MAKSKALVNAETQIAELIVKLAALEAKVEIINMVCNNQRTRIDALEAQLNTRGVKVIPAVAVAPVTRTEVLRAAATPAKGVAVVTRFTKRDGSVIEKTRIGSRASERVISPATHVYVGGRLEPIFTAEYVAEMDALQEQCLAIADLPVTREQHEAAKLANYNADF